MSEHADLLPPESMVELRARFLSKSLPLSPRQYSVLGHCLYTPDIVAFGSTYTVAAHCRVSTATMTRLSRQLGFPSYKQFKRVFQKQILDRSLQVSSGAVA